ncbi:hypothetical protein BSL78_00698 [Apostichopus japonicus]|uniref:Uncharacterized protein n=1 Tax=Stichopus japonicus TaxID=307972 RepID=A0A2G8LQ43_STIJA|nr:hypothetical protein BSL78_00698 [Apostichopus japonicus]
MNGLISFHSDTCVSRQELVSCRDTSVEPYSGSQFENRIREEPILSEIQNGDILCNQDWMVVIECVSDGSLGGSTLPLVQIIHVSSSGVSYSKRYPCVGEWRKCNHSGYELDHRPSVSRQGAGHYGNREAGRNYRRIEDDQLNDRQLVNNSDRNVQLWEYSPPVRYHSNDLPVPPSDSRLYRIRTEVRPVAFDGSSE